MNINIQNETFENISSPNLSLPSDFNIIKEENEAGEFYYREISLSHIIIEITILIPDNLSSQVSFLFKANKNSIK